MAFTLDQVVPWGRSFDEYRRMFALSDDDLGLRILGCADGPASFNGEADHARRARRAHLRESAGTLPLRTAGASAMSILTKTRAVPQRCVRCLSSSPTD
jgi:hypothetical protein